MLKLPSLLTRKVGDRRVEPRLLGSFSFVANSAGRIGRNPAVASVADSKLARLNELKGKQQLGHKSFWVSLLDEDLVDGAFATDHPFVRYALQPGVLRIMGDFMHELPQLSDVLLTLSQPTENKPLSYSQLWHLDHDDKRVCKLFIYLTDVRDTKDGPLTFIPAPSSKPFRNTVKSHMSDDKVFAKVDRSAVKEIVAPRLSSFRSEERRVGKECSS